MRFPHIIKGIYCYHKFDKKSYQSFHDLIVLFFFHHANMIATISQKRTFTALRLRKRFCEIITTRCRGSHLEQFCLEIIHSHFLLILIVLLNVLVRGAPRFSHLCGTLCPQMQCLPRKEDGQKSVLIRGNAPHSTCRSYLSGGKRLRAVSARCRECCRTILVKKFRIK